jgi:DNA-binding beta-propeller fold protein YncE
VSATITGLGALKGSFSNYGIAADDTAIWVHNGDTGNLLRIDPQSNKVVATIPVGIGAGQVAIGDGAIWVATVTTGEVARVDPQTNKVVATVDAGADGGSLAVSPGAVWVTDFTDSTLLRIDPQTNKVVATIPNQPGPSDVSFGAGTVWVSNRAALNNGLLGINPQTNKVQTQVDVSGTDGLDCTAVVALNQSIWTVDLVLGDGSSVVLKRIDPATKTVKMTVPVPGTVPFHFAADEHGVWTWGPAGLYRIDPQSNQVVGTLAATGGAGVALGAGSLWFARSDGTLLRITPAS